MTATDPTSSPEHAALLDEMRTELAEIRALRAALEHTLSRSTELTSVNGPTSVPQNDTPVSRRAALRTAGMVAAGAIASGAGIVATAAPAAAGTADYAATSTHAGISVTASPGTFNAIEVLASGTATAVSIVANGPALWSQSNDPNFPAIRGAASGGTGIVGMSTSGTSSATGIGGDFSGDLTALFLSGFNLPPVVRSDTFDVGMMDNDLNGDLWYCVGWGAPGDWRKLAGPSTAGAFHAIAPARVYDSRAALPSTGVLTNGANRTISVAHKRDNAGTVVTNNIVPVGTKAVAANVTVTGTTGTNNICINPGGDTSHNSSTINWFASGQTIANGVTLSLNTTRQITAVAGGQGGSAHVIIDITGYWR